MLQSPHYSIKAKEMEVNSAKSFFMVVFVGIAVKIFKKVLDIVGYHGKKS